MGVGIELGVAFTGLLGSVVGVLGSVVGLLNPGGLLALLFGLIP